MKVVIILLVVMWALATAAWMKTRRRSRPPVSTTDEWSEVLDEAEHERATGRLVCTRERDAVRLTFFGPQDVPIDRSALGAMAVARPADVIVDVDEVTEASAGFGAAMLLVVRLAHLAGAEVSILGHNPAVDRVLALNGLDELVGRGGR